jgi:GntR family transcriptional repressor for pyruvate dehydrogenase complex
MRRKSLVGTVADDLLDRIVDGTYPPGAALPSEAQIGEQHDVSRVTVREAIKILQAQSVIRIENGKGSFVNPVSEWKSIDAVVRVSAARGGDKVVAVQLLEVRRMFETAAAALAAPRISPAQLKQLRAALERMQRAHDVNDLSEFVASDLAFHEAVLEASGNVFLPAMLEPVARIIAERRTQTSSVPVIQEHAIAGHLGILDALASGDPESARRAMESHLDQTLKDLLVLVPE